MAGENAELIRDHAPTTGPMAKPNTFCEEREHRYGSGPEPG